MRKLVMLLCATITLMSCKQENPGIIWDIIPASFDIIVIDDQGNNLLDSTNVNNILSTIKVEMNGTEFEPIVSGDTPWGVTKAIFPAPVALRKVDAYNKGLRYQVLNFGEFGYTNEQTSYKIKLTYGKEALVKEIELVIHMNIFNKGRDLETYHNLYVDGTEVANQGPRSSLTIEYAN